MSETDPESEVYGGLLGCIELKGMSPAAARLEVLQEFETDRETVNKLLETHWGNRYADKTNQTEQ